MHSVGTTVQQLPAVAHDSSTTVQGLPAVAPAQCQHDSAAIASCSACTVSAQHSSDCQLRRMHRVSTTVQRLPAQCQHDIAQRPLGEPRRRVFRTPGQLKQSTPNAEKCTETIKSTALVSMRAAQDESRSPGQTRYDTNICEGAESTALIRLGGQGRDRDEQSAQRAEVKRGEEERERERD